MADQATLPEDQEFFKLNEVCKIANVQPYMLRFWGTEFTQLEAAKSGTGQRLYSRDQVTVILEIRRLLFDEGLTIAGARKRIGALQEDGSLPAAETPKIADEEPAKPKKTVKPKKAVEPKPAPAAAKAPAEKVDKAATKRVQPLLATLKDVRKEVAKIVADLKTD
jgi:DNA-binding transcriptional MerR regulator